MKKLLLASTAMFAAGAMVGIPMQAASAADGIKLSVGGHFKQAYMIISHDDGEGELGEQRNVDGLFNDAEIDFTGSTVLDNGLEVGARMELEGETDGDQIDEAFIWFAGGFGELRIGSDDEALHKACVIPPGGSSNFSAFSPNQWAANTIIGQFGDFSDNTICTGVDGREDAQKLIYTSPILAGFQLTASYTPDPDVEDHTDGGGPHTGMSSTPLGEAAHNVSAAINYSYFGKDWGVEASLGGSWQTHINDDLGVEIPPGVGANFDFNERDFYQAGINVHFGNFSFGVGGEYFNDLMNQRIDVPFQLIDIETDAWTAGIGAAYRHDAWIFGAQYSHHESETDLEVGPFPSPIGDGFEFTQDRAVATVTYLLGPGMNLDAELGYTWLDSDPEIPEADADGDIDDYQAFEIGMGATLTF